MPVTLEWSGQYEPTLDTVMCTLNSASPDHSKAVDVSHPLPMSSLSDEYEPTLDTVT